MAQAKSSGASARAAAAPDTLAASQVGLTDTVVVFPSVATLSADGATWSFDIRAWVAIPARSRVRKAAAEALLDRLLGVKVTNEARPLFDQRIDLLFADNKGRRRLVVDVAGKRFTLNPTGANGHSTTTITLDTQAVAGVTKEGRITFDVIFPARDVRKVSQSVRLVSGPGVSILSDIDDTVKISHVTDRALLMRKTFLEPYVAVDGMAALLSRIGGRDAPVHYVSSTPWHFGEPLMDFMKASGLPYSELQLKHVRIKDGTVFDLFKSPTETKPPQILQIFKRFPQRTFILIGDNGEADPEVYGQIARQHPKQVARILIRNCCPEKAQAERFEKAFKGLPRDLWQVFSNPNEVKAPL